MSFPYPKKRLRRLRQSQTMRNLISQTRLDVNKIMLPLFIIHGHQKKIPIASMPGHYQISTDYLAEEIDTLIRLGIKSVMLFGIPASKDGLGSSAYAEDGVIQKAIPIIKQLAPHMLVFTDLCFCEYTDHGHCGVVNDKQQKEVNVDNDATLHLLAQQAISHAKAGADVIAPSGNMDGMVAAIRFALDDAGFSHVPILSYSVKYASAMYGPFREAAGGTPQFGDRKTYQMDFCNTYEALHECALDVDEGADMLMVKPAHTYLDIIYKVKQQYPELPLCAYHTSGEYAMLKAAIENNWLSEKQSVLEVLTAIHRAGADFIISYFAKDVAKWLKDDIS